MANLIEIVGTYKDNFSSKFKQSLDNADKKLKSVYDNADKKTKLLSDKIGGLSALLPTQFQGVAGGFDDVSSSISKAAASLGPYGIAAAGAIAVGTALFVNAIKIEKEFSILRKTLGNVDEQMRINAKTISGSFDLSLQQVASTTEKLSTLFNITDKSGLDVLQKGLSKTIGSAEEFIDIFNEFSPIFKDMGLNAKQSSALVDELLNKGVNQKGADAIKEFSNKFSEMGKSQQEALTGIGINFNDLSKKVKSGAITQFDAMKIVSDKISDLGTNSTQAKTALTAMFGGPGEDLGMIFQKTLSEINTNLDDMPDKISDIGKATSQLSSAWETFKGIFTGGADGNWFSNTIASMIDGLTTFLNMFNNIFNAANWTERLKAISNVIVTSLLLPIQLLIGGLGQLGEALGIDALTNLNNWITKHSQFDIDTGKLANMGTNMGQNTTLGASASKSAASESTVSNLTVSNLTKKSADSNSDKTKQLAETRDIKSLVINIENVVREQYIETTQDPLKVKDLVTRALTAAITDAKLAY